ncbi:3011_t:CDS:2 [Racocetra fulgida]|uniref:Glutamate--cysteine ligase n=1 Tax=Racocetra fulgida TaxID=60492 RepID=A0A9N8YVY2_9GLOM|nr:3011_t:CDS:2 [Racocetra fulgida]
MGLLSKGKLLPWEQTKQYADHIRNQGINQFLSIYNKAKDRENDSLLWGDEIEYMVIAYDDGNKNVKLSLRAQDILQELQKEVEEALRKGEVVDALWHPEFGAYMIEGVDRFDLFGVPGIPYGSSLKSLTLVEQNMKLRREIASKYLNPNESLVTLVNFPRLGCSSQFLEPHYEPFGPELRSLFVPDEALNPHAKFRAVNAGIEGRRGSKAALNVPIFHDKKSQNSFIYCEEALPDHIYMDSAVFGGYLSDIDCRWMVLAECADDRTKEERSLEDNKFSELIKVMLQYLESGNIDVETRYQLENYLEFVDMHASATWIRNFVRSHPNYNHDSVVSQEINYDLIKMIEKIQNGQIKMPELLGEFKIN